jgi:uncharacterized LabA/DUF88 family protein
MAESPDGRVAVYIDFDNIVISRYNQLYGRNQFSLDRMRDFDDSTADAAQRTRAAAATVDIGAVLDFASSFGTIVLSRAYADWSMPVNAGYRRQLIGRAVDLTQLFPSTRGMKNGADIRLAVDVVEDLFRLTDLTHIVIAAGDSDYIALAQRSKRLGRYVVGIGVAGATSKSLAAACDEFADYDALPGIVASAEQKHAEDAAAALPDELQEPPKRRQPRKKAAQALDDDSAGEDDQDDAADAEPERPDEDATGLLVRALRLGHAKDDSDWLHSSAVKTQMKRMDPSFNEKSLGFRSFSDFVTSRSDVVEMKEDGQARRIRLKPALLDQK